MTFIRAPASPGSRLGIGVVLSDEGGATGRRLARAWGPTLGRLTAFCEALSVVTGLGFNPRGAANYQELLLRLSDDVDIAWLPPLVALRALRDGEAKPLALPVRGGVALFSSALFSRADSGYRTLDDVVGARAAWVDPQSLGGYLLVRAALRSKGFDLHRGFTSEWFAGTHDAVVRAVREGDADVGATFVHCTEDGRIRRAAWRKMSATLLHLAGPIPSDVIACSTRVDDALAEVVRAALLGEGTADLTTAASSLFGAEGFTEFTSNHLVDVEALVELLDPDLEETTYPSLPPAAP